MGGKGKQAITSYRCGVSFELLKRFHDFARACVGCTQRVGARPWLLCETIALRMVRQKTKKTNTATLARATRWSCSRAQKSSVWLYLSLCVTERKIPLCRGG